ncbi:MAG TPA: peptidase [Dialister sp.]|nr:peptidase [Dialister sp.]
MKYIDLHCDTITELALRPERGNLAKNNCEIDISKLQKGQCFIQDFAIWYDQKNEEAPWDYFQKLLAVYQREIAANDCMHPILKASDIDLCEKNEKIGAMLSIEGGEVIGGSLEKLQEAYDAGVRLMTLTWNYANELAFPNGMEGPDKGITPVGWEVIEAMNRMGMIVDTSHLNDVGTEEILKSHALPPVASHSDARAITGHQRNLTDPLIRLFADKGGLIGLNFSNHFTGDSEITKVENIVRHAQHIRDIGGDDVLAIGTDFDGIQPTLEIEDASQMDKLAVGLSKRGFTDDEIEKIFYLNAKWYLMEYLGK